MKCSLGYDVIQLCFLILTDNVTRLIITHQTEEDGCVEELVEELVVAGEA